MSQLGSSVADVEGSRAADMTRLMEEPGLRILWLSHFVPYPPTGGNLQRSYHLLRQAAGHHRVHLVSLNMRAVLPTRDLVDDAVRELSRLCVRVDVFPNPWDRSSLHRLAIAGLSFFHPQPYDRNWLRSAALRAYLKSLAGTETFDLIHVDTVGLVPYATPFDGVPIVLNHHNVESQLAHRRAEREEHPFRRLYFRRDAGKLQRLERRVCAAVAVNLTVSELDAARLREIAPAARTCVIENGVDVDYFRPGVTGQSDTGGLVFAGTLNWYPNQEAVRYFLREVWPALLQDDPRRHVTFVGRDPPAELQEAARDRRVLVTGRVEDVRPYLDAAAIYVCPIRDGGGTRLKILDAFAMAKPLVATALAVEGLDVEDGRHYLRAETPGEFVAQIRRLEGDAPLRKRLGQAARDLVVGRYAWDAIGRKLDGAYRQVARLRRAES